MATSTSAGSATSLEDVLEVLQAAATKQVLLWIDGGWGVDALLETQTREHGDLDLAIRTSDAAAFEETLAALGYERCHEPSATAWNFLMANSCKAVVDLHLIDLEEAGNGVLGPVKNGNIYPADSLRGQGRMGGRLVRCIAPEHAIAFHDAYEGDADDRADVRALCARFDLPLPQQYQ